MAIKMQKLATRRAHVNPWEAHPLGVPFIDNDYHFMLLDSSAIAPAGEHAGTTPALPVFE
ncbi:hypothetical protein QMU90_000926 [Edwardsiella ictaluri]|nr:hypothetical protein [Edwardsiella ictaluri]KMQ79313.1 hypothetical protein ABY58_03615 [Edwardsiella ictaluri]KOO55871.1 hypothetical protein ACS33_04365 [Edwardsiella ictaluri]